MARDRANCPCCDRSISLSPEGRKFACHNVSRHSPAQWCAGSNCSVAEARRERLGQVEWAKIIETDGRIMFQGPAGEQFEIVSLSREVAEFVAHVFETRGESDDDYC